MTDYLRETVSVLWQLAMEAAYREGRPFCWLGHQIWEARPWNDDYVDWS